MFRKPTTPKNSENFAQLKLLVKAGFVSAKGCIFHIHHFE
jgi:hypothetical protein